MHYTPNGYMHTSNVWSGIPQNQFGFGVLKADPYQRGHCVYKVKRGRKQAGYGLGSILLSLGRRLGPKLIPLAKRVGTSAVKQGIKALPGLLSSQNKKQAAKNLAKSIGKQALGQAISVVSSRRPPKRKRKFARRVRRKGQFTQIQ